MDTRTDQYEGRPRSSGAAPISVSSIWQSCCWVAPGGRTPVRTRDGERRNEEVENVAHAAGSLIGWIIGGAVSAFPAWALSEWGRAILFGKDKTSEKD